MKVLEQIVRYLEQRGALSAEEVEALERAGFVPREEEEEEQYRDEWEFHEYDEEGPEPRARPKPKGRLRRRPLKPAVLAARLREAMRDSDAELRALAAIAPIEGHVERWDRIAILARSPAEAVAESMSAAIDRGAVSFHALWEALGADAHLRAVRPGETGPSASAYRALLALRDHRDIGKHLWILRRRIVSRAYELLRAQDRAAEALLAVYRARPERLGKWIAREPHPVAYWAFVLLYNAERAVGVTFPEARTGEHPARRALPSIADFARAWARAIQLGGERCASYLVRFWRAEIRSRELWATLSPPGSPQVYSEGWLRAEIAANPSVEKGLGPRLLEAMRALGRLDFGPAERLVEDGLAGAPASVAPPSFARPLPASLHVTLVCPSGWN